MVKARLLGAVGIATVVGGITGGLAAQSPAGPTFEVASVKVSNTARVLGVPPPHGIFRAENWSLSTLIERAYGVSPSEISGGPSWMQTERFDINAKFEGDATWDEQLIMLRQLLAERFQLQIRHESKELHVYNLERLHDDGKLGPKLTASTRDCGNEDPVDPKDAVQMFLAKQAPDCGKVFSWEGRIAGTATSTDLLMKLLNVRADLDGPIVDRTGLVGLFDWDLSWTPSTGAASVDPFGVSIFTALGDQLGLRLRSTRSIVDILVVEHAEKPTPN
jgi:uncharacterized protein (TIGR03435 family)